MRRVRDAREFEVEVYAPTQDRSRFYPGTGLPVVTGAQRTVWRSLVTREQRDDIVERWASIGWPVAVRDPGERKFRVVRNGASLDAWLRGERHDVVTGLVEINNGRKQGP